VISGHPCGGDGIYLGQEVSCGELSQRDGSRKERNKRVVIDHSDRITAEGAAPGTQAAR